MTGCRRALVRTALCAGSLLAGSQLGAQGMLRSAMAFGTVSEQAGGPGAASLFLQPALGLQAPYVRALFRMQATPLARLHGPQLFDGAVRTGDLQFRGVQLSLAARVEATQPAFVRDGYGRAGVELQAGTSSPAQGLSAGIGLRRTSMPGASVNAPTARVGGWFRRLGISFSGEVTATQVTNGFGADSNAGASGGGPVDSLVLSRFRPDVARALADTPIVLGPPVSTPTLGARALMATEARFTVASRVAGLDVDAVGGAFLFSSARNAPYGSITLTRWLTSDAAITGGLVQRVLDPVRGTSVRMAMLGIRMAVRGSPQLPSVDAFPADAAAGFRVERASAEVHLSLEAPGARTVELQGDATDWAPVAMTRDGHDRWTVALRLRPGVYYILVRLDDGMWRPPPGVPRGVDPYEGTVGVVVVD